MSKDVIIACDFDSIEKTEDFISKFNGYTPYFKIGMELYYSAGAEIVYRIKNRGYKVFLDLKLHDIPNTVKKSMAVLAKLGVDICNLHAAGGSEMMKYALDGLSSTSNPRPLCIAVTQLTSTSEERMHNELLIPRPLDEVVMSYAKTAADSGLDGVVCSPLEAQKVKNVCGESFLTVTPGIRLAGGELGDQVRVTTPAKARLLGSDYIVVGRPITAADDPIEAYIKCRNDFLGVENNG